MKGSEPFSSEMGIRTVTFSCCFTSAWQCVRACVLVALMRVCVHIELGLQHAYVYV